MAKEPTLYQEQVVDRWYKSAWLGIIVVLALFWSVALALVYAAHRDKVERADKLKVEAAADENYGTLKMIELGGVEWIAACAAAKGKDGASFDDIKRDCIPAQMLRKEGQ